VHSYTALAEVGKQFNAAKLGSHAVNSLRIEKGFKFKADLDFAHYTEAGIDRFLAKKKDFRGKLSDEGQCVLRIVCEVSLLALWVIVFEASASGLCLVGSSFGCGRIVVGSAHSSNCNQLTKYRLNFCCETSHRTC
jgi:hypothetical protein